MGKGGVGKSTVASAIALALAEAGHKVHLSTTDPAAHLNLVLDGARSGIGDRFTVSRINPETEVAASVPRSCLRLAPGWMRTGAPVG